MRLLRIHLDPAVKVLAEVPVMLEPGECFWYLESSFNLEPC